MSTLQEDDSYMTAAKQHLSILTFIWITTLFTLNPASANPVQEEPVAMVPIELGTIRDSLGTPENPIELIDLIRNPDLIKPGAHVTLINPTGQEVVVLPSEEKEQFSEADKWTHTRALMKAVGWKLPPELKAQNVEVKSIRVTGTASTYGRNDGFAGQRTSSGRMVSPTTAALQMDLAHVLSDMGVVPFSMRDVKATLTMPDGRKVAKRLEDKGGLVNYLGENYWRKAIKTMSVDQNGVGTLAPLPASHYRVVDIFTQRRSTLIPQVTVEIHLKKPLVRKAALSPGQCQAWMMENFEDPTPTSQGFVPEFE